MKRPSAAIPPLFFEVALWVWAALLQAALFWIAWPALAGTGRFAAAPALCCHLLSAALIAALPPLSRREILLRTAAAFSDALRQGAEAGISRRCTGSLRTLRRWAYLDEARYQRTADAVRKNRDLSLTDRLWFSRQCDHLFPDAARQRLQTIRYHGTLFAWLILFFPVLGFMGSLATHTALRIALRAKGLVDAYQEETRHVLDHLGEGEQVDLIEELSVQPALAILEGDDPEMKRGALELLGRIGSPEAVRILRRALSDENPELRFHAHAALEKLDRRHGERITELTGRMELEGESIPLLMELGTAYHGYADSALLERDAAAHYRTLALGCLKTARRQAPEQSDIAHRLGQMYLEMDRPRDAIPCLEQAAHHAPAPAEAILDLCRAHFDLGDFNALHRTAERLIPLSYAAPLPDPDKDLLIRFWGVPTAAFSEEV